jgi:hypothetical protein
VLCKFWMGPPRSSSVTPLPRAGQTMHVCDCAICATPADLAVILEFAVWLGKDADLIYCGAFRSARRSSTSL